MAGTKIVRASEKKPRPKPPRAGMGRPKGIPNKSTTAAREAIARLVDGNAERLQAWLDQIAEERGPMDAWRCMMDVIEYHIPKLARTEHTGADGKDLIPPPPERPKLTREEWLALHGPQAG